MAVIYLQHPVHGSKVACTNWEAEYDEKNGWVRYDPELPDFFTKSEPEQYNQLQKPKRGYNRG